MQLGAFLLLAVTALLTCCDAVSASENVSLSVTETTSSDLGRSLRTSETGDDRRIKDLDDEERTKEFHQDMAKWLAKLTETSVPKSEKNTFGESMANWFATLTSKREKLTKSNSLKRLEADEAIVMDRLQHSLTQKFKSSKQDPDEMFNEMKLNPEYAGIKKFDHKLFQKASDNYMETYARYYLWHSYSAYYRTQHPKWVSKLGKAS
ncbi:hypothetical protein PF005_g28081 [Phytophthora fragariae]|uniref:RxLR effector protein n=1 Tax=Phytophthora fragariae TaxID=53985 RepID=A0A6A4BBL8_9STRA|nr:hypothetical protein PF003_g27472 [Phytophthora fragariae]KAE8921516.1 hypothetical protein PF009_g28208 [Phytophthora fragariae]KAE8970100.1 hypothetical protein PF011_g26548 [Phytophthora fragariae]KAE9066171.1 hypothetical protein PF010_g27912 [Phytophthora fragariae]KAE9069525.1 hypothetical protein PF007_g27283 [Phytophthora fragariae]